ncbi:MAG: heme lyase CcmF/NrfE family subunit [Gemmatimonadaceae bacterium]|nr:heme lyase CcmF/NrfE family subunit [Gemmatimonadaceae bacterium]
MTRLIGLNALMVALAVAAFGVVMAPIGVRRARADLVRATYSATYAMFALVTIATFAMIFALVTHDFSVGYVAQVGSRATPLFYTIISLWGALEGSILFWAWVLSLLSALVVFWNRDREGALIPYTTMTMLAVSVFFLILLVGPANPFTLIAPTPLDGPGPNPLLQNHILMGVHPPLLYLGYVGMTVPFAFAVGAMAAGEVGEDTWIKLSRRWTLGAWAFLTAAIIAGMWWSYEVLGWGGYWAWDPVENASFMPWLTSTAFLHSMMVQERRGMLKLWNLNLIVATFALTILGTFLTRSGVLSSVHAFGEGPIGMYFLGAIAVTLVASFALVAGNSEQLSSEGRLDSVASRETVILLNNLMLTAFTFTVLVGTLFPIIAEAARGVKVSVGEPFFNKMSLPLIASLLFLMGVGPALPWRRASKEVVRRQLLPPLIGAVIAAVAAIAVGAHQVYAVLTFAFAAFALVANVREYVTGVKARMTLRNESAVTALGRLVGANRRRYGGYIAHLGIIAMGVAIAASSTFRREYEATLRKGESMAAGGYSVKLLEVYGREEPQRSRIAASVAILEDGAEIGRLDPAMNFYPTSQQPIPTPAVRSRAWGDIYINLMAFQQDGSNATLKVIVEPLVPWIWFGGGIICLGAIVSMFPTRRRSAAWMGARVAPDGRGARPSPGAATPAGGMLASNTLEGAD